MNAGYDNARIGNLSTGKREFVMLFDPQNEKNDYLLSSEYPIELRADLTRALSAFSPLKQRILVRVLLQGQSVREATKGMRGSKDTHERWLYKTALPRLRSLLADYKEQLRTTLYSPPLIPASEDNAEPRTLKCKFCGHHESNNCEAVAYNKLKKHIKKEHRKEFAAVKKYVHAKDYEIRSFELSMQETGKEISHED